MVSHATKKFQLNFFEVACVGTVDAVGQWKWVSETIEILFYG
jgi:hypothetical protein